VATAVPAPRMTTALRQRGQSELSSYETSR
jgi:hypothetical protein